jgi:hypothetical protein
MLVLVEGMKFCVAMTKTKVRIKDTKFGLEEDLFVLEDAVLNSDRPRKLIVALETCPSSRDTCQKMLQGDIWG